MAARKHRQYSEADKATALALLQANGGNLSRTASELKMPLATLQQWRDGKGIHPDVLEKREEKKELLDGLFEQVARTYLGRALSDDAVTASSGKDAIITAATAVDKMRLLREQPTQITDTTARVDLSRLSLEELKSLEQIAERLAGPGGDPGGDRPQVAP